MRPDNKKEWNKIIKLTESMRYGQVTIKVQNGEISIEEYTVKKKPGDEEIDQNDIVTGF